MANINLKHITEKEKQEIKEALDRGVEEVRFKHKIPQMLEEAKIREENKWIANEVEIEWY